MKTSRQAPRPVRVGVFAGVGPADAAIVSLLNGGFTRNQITVVAPESFRDHFDREQLDSKPPGGSNAFRATATGGALGAALGGILAALAVGGIGGLGLSIAGMVAAGAVIGATVGGFIGAMMSRGLEKETTDFYDQALKQGKILVGVEYEGPGQRARLELADRTLADAGAEPLSLAKG